MAVTEVLQEEWKTSLPAVGSLTAVSGVNVTTEVAGIVKSIYFESGQSVKKGQLLIELDTATDLAELKGLLAERKLARIQFARTKELIVKKFVSKSDHDRNLAMLDEADAAVQTKKTLIEKKRIRAPFSGELGIRQIDLGQYLDSGSSIVALTQLDPIYIDFNLPERYLGSVVLGQTVEMTVQAYGNRIFNGQITAISPMIDQNTRSARIRASLENPGRLLRPGMFAQLNVLSNRPRNVATLPDTAISYNPYGDFIFVVVKKESGFYAQSRQVETGETRNGRIEIVNGVKPGETVVSAGQIKLRNGMPVSLDDKPAPGERSEDTSR
ncbi:MAG: efflux RND transporter periplasmic adaptor subunit [Gammaproteobacteria bacterium]